MICGATEVYMTLWTGKVERVLVLAPLRDEIKFSECKRIAIVSDGLPKTYSKLDCVGTDGCKSGIETRHLA